MARCKALAFEGRLRIMSEIDQGLKQIDAAEKYDNFFKKKTSKILWKEVNLIANETDLNAP